MKYKAVFFSSLSILSCAVLAVVGLRARHQWIERVDATHVTIARSTWDALDGVRLAFTGPIESVTWSIHGRVSTTKLANPSTTISLRTELPQGQRISLQVLGIQSRYGQNVPEHWTLSHAMPAALQATTNPGPWQLNVPRSGPYSVTFDAPVENPTSIGREVTFAPTIPGKWVWEDPETAEYFPKKRLLPTVQEAMRVGDGPNGLRSIYGQYLTSPVTRSFITQSDEEIIVRESLPETLTLVKNGKVILRSLCNTAVTGAYTPTGTFYIRSKFPHVVMKGVNPNGTHYDDPHVPWVMGLIGNVAIHGYPRASYGFPQSNGCVELPIATAKRLYRMVDVGTPVTIEGPRKPRANSRHAHAKHPSVVKSSKHPSKL